jgi:hypothetical protein
MTPERRQELKQQLDTARGLRVGAPSGDAKVDFLAAEITEAVLRGLADGLAEALDDNETLETLFDKQWSRSVRATRAWQDAHPGQSHTYPDLGELLDWLLDRTGGGA